MVWWGLTAPVAKVSGETVSYVTASSTPAASQGLRPPHSLQAATEVRTVRNPQPDIVIRKVKTQPIAAGAWGG
jgi:hypothetical protein